MHFDVDEGIDFIYLLLENVCKIIIRLPLRLSINRRGVADHGRFTEVCRKKLYKVEMSDVDESTSRIHMRRKMKDGGEDAFHLFPNSLHVNYPNT